jgi:energy-coupling factor transporter ATP-binding protein EcfA2
VTETASSSSIRTTRSSSTVRREMELEHPGRHARSATRRAARLGELERSAAVLSLGEQRRPHGRHGAARRPNVLLLDEPFIGQDRRNVYG